MSQEMILPDWTFPQDGDALDVGLLETSTGKFVGFIFGANKEHPMRIAMPADVAIRIARAMVYTALEIQGKIAEGTVEPAPPEGLPN